MVKIYGSALTRKLSIFIELSRDELNFLADLESKRFNIKRGQQLAEEGNPTQTSFILHAGWGCCFKITSNGGRQITNFPISGDWVGLDSILLPAADQSFSALTDIAVSFVAVSRIFDLFREFPRLGAALLRLASGYEAMKIEHLTSIGRRSAIERTAHFFLELAERLALVGLVTERQFCCPLNQYSIADALGLSSIHINRTLRRLRELNLLSIKSGHVTLHDIDGLARLAGYRSVNFGAEINVALTHVSEASDRLVL
jgi:CRP-like cAMP-binding protein